MNLKKQNPLIYTVYIPLGILLLNLILKIIYLSYGSLSGDEPFTVFHAQMDFNKFSEILIHENNPPPFFILLHYWIKLFGISTFSVRFLPYIFSSLTAFFIYKIGQKHFNFRIAILTSLIFTFSNFHIYFSHETRVYSLFALLTVMSMHYFLSLIKDTSSKKLLTLLIITNALLIYSHFFGFFVLAIQGLSVLFITDFRKKLFKKYFFISLATLILYIPYIRIILFRFTESTKGTWVEKPNWEELYNLLWKFSNLPVNTVLFIVILVSGIVVYILKKEKIKSIVNSEFVKVIAIWFLFPYLFIFLASQWIPMFVDRYLIFISIGFYFLIAIALNYLFTTKKLFYPISILIIGLMIFTSKPTSGRGKHFENMIDLVIKNKTENSIVYLCPGWINYGFAYYYNVNYFKNYAKTNALLNTENIFMPYNDSEINGSQLTDSVNVIYVQGWSELIDPENLIYKKLKENFSDVKLNQEYEHYKISFFSNQ